MCSIFVHVEELCKSDNIIMAGMLHATTTGQINNFWGDVLER